MHSRLLVVLLILGACLPAHATYSIVARDPATGQLGVAVQSHWFSVGQIVSWAEAGVGAVATQAAGDPSYGKVGLELMRAGRPAPAALKGLLAADEGAATRQVAMIDAQGRVAAHTGEKAIAHAGHIVADDFSVQANLMASPEVWPAMEKAFRSAKGDLAERMLAAMDAAQAAGGDIRGQQSASLIVVSATPTGKPWVDRVYDLRVDDHPEPVKELRRLVRTQRAYHHLAAAEAAVGAKDAQKAVAEYAKARKLLPDSGELRFWNAVGLVNLGKTDEALPVFRDLFAREPQWRELVPRVMKVGILPDDAALRTRILGNSQTPSKPAPKEKASPPARVPGR